MSFRGNRGPFQGNHGSFQRTDIRWIIGGGLTAAEDVGTWGRKAPGSDPTRGSIPECVLSHIAYIVGSNISPPMV